MISEMECQKKSFLLGIVQIVMGGLPFFKSEEGAQICVQGGGTPDQIDCDTFLRVKRCPNCVLGGGL